MNIVQLIRILPIFVIGAGGAGCVSKDYTALEAGFSSVTLETEKVTGSQSVWVQNQQQAEAVNNKVKSILASLNATKRQLDVGTAVQIALLNNKGLQASYADLGIAATEAWQQSLLPNPKIAISALGIGTPGLEAFSSIEGTITNSIITLATLKKRVGIADTEFRAAQLNAALETLILASKTRKAWITAVSARETVSQLAQAESTADAASELAQKLGETGALSKGEQAREHAFVAELAGEVGKARLEARLAEEALTRLMGLWQEGDSFKLPGKLPNLPKKLIAKVDIEREALQNRVDLKVMRLNLEAAAKAAGLTNATRYVRDLDLVSGSEVSRTSDGDKIENTATAKLEIDFTIPIFDSGAAANRKAELLYMKAANKLAEAAVNVRSEARSAYDAYRSSYSLAQHYRGVVVPLRTTVESEAALTYNGMISNTFELLSDNRDRIAAQQAANAALRDFWLAEAELVPVVYGGGGDGGNSGPSSTQISPGQ